MSNNTTNKSSNKRTAPASADIANLGLACQTKRSRNSAWEPFEEYQHENGENHFVEIADIDDDEAKGEIVKDRLVSFADWLATTPLKKKSNPNESITSDSVVQYLGSVKEMMKDQTSKLSIWDNYEEEWYTMLRCNLKAAVTKRLQRG